MNLVLTHRCINTINLIHASQTVLRRNILKKIKIKNKKNRKNISLQIYTQGESKF